MTTSGCYENRQKQSSYQYFKAIEDEKEEEYKKASRIRPVWDETGAIHVGDSIYEDNEDEVHSRTQVARNYQLAN